MVSKEGCLVQQYAKLYQIVPAQKKSTQRRHHACAWSEHQHQHQSYMCSPVCVCACMCLYVRTANDVHFPTKYLNGHFLIQSDSIHQPSIIFLSIFIPKKSIQQIIYVVRIVFILLIRSLLQIFGTSTTRQRKIDSNGMEEHRCDCVRPHHSESNACELTKL